MPAQIITTRCLDLEELVLTPWLGLEAGEGIGSWLDCGAGEIVVGGFIGTGEAGVGATKGEGEGVRKLLEGDVEGEFDDGDGKGEFDDGDENSEGGIETENGNGDGEEGWLSGGEEDGEADVDNKPRSFPLALLTLDDSFSSATCCSLR